MPETENNVDIYKQFPVEFMSLVRETNKLMDRIVNKPSKIAKIFSLSYKLTKDGISDIFYTIQEKLSRMRIEDANFIISLHFDDKTFESYPSLDTFLNSHETLPKCAKSIKLSWQMTIFSEGISSDLKKVIGEQYKIEILFSTPPEEIEDSDIVFYKFNDEIVEGFGIVDVTVQHCDKIWAIEVINHISDFLKRVELKNRGLREFVYKKRKFFSNLVSGVIRISPLIPILYLIIYYRGSEVLTLLPVQILGLSFLFFIISNLFSRPVKDFLYSQMIKLKSRSAIIINEFSKNKYEQDSIGKKTIIISVFFLLYRFY